MERDTVPRETLDRGRLRFGQVDVKAFLNESSQILDVAPVEPVDGVALVAQSDRLELRDAGIVRLEGLLR